MVDDFDVCFLVFSLQRWDYSNRKFMFLNLSERINKKSIIIFIDRPLNFLPGSIFKEKLLHPLKFIINKIHINEKLIIFRPIYFFHEQFLGGKVNKVNKKLLESQLLKNGLDLAKFKKIVYWIYSPYFLPFYQSLIPNEKYLIYEVFDEITKSPLDKIHKTTARIEPKTLNEANIIFTISDSVASVRSHYKNKVVVIGNGINYEYFDNKENLKDPPHDICFIKKPIICLSGVIRNWIDFKLLESLILSNSDLSFVLIGKVEKNVSKKVKTLISEFSNVHHLGYKSQSELAKYYSYIDVGIIPYLQTDFIKSSRPIKLFEFLASGVPVVSVPVDVHSITEIPGVIYIAYDIDEFQKKIRKAINDKSTNFIKLRKEIAKQNSWEKINNKIIEKIYEFGLLERH